MEILETYEQLKYADAAQMISARMDGHRLPRKAEIEARRKFDEDDHWQAGAGFIGQLPEGENALARTETLRRGFCPENVIAEVLDTHTENVLGEAPQISLSGEGFTDAQILELTETVRAWMDAKGVQQAIERAARTALRENAAVLRVFIPSGMITGAEQSVKADTLADALAKIWIRAETADKGGVVTDEDSATDLGLFLYKMKIDRQTTVSLAEYAYLDAQNQTVWGTLSAHNSNLGAEQADRMNLGGRLPIYEMRAGAPLVTESVCQMQRALNLSNTMLTRNNNLAGSRERLFLNVQPKGEWVSVGEDEDGNEIREFRAEPMATGPGTANFLQALTTTGADDAERALGNPNVIFTDPVPIETFVGTRDFWYRNILAKCKQKHLLMQADATASGRSRIEARREFESSLKKTKSFVDPAGAWAIETALNIAAHFINQPEAFQKIKAEFSAQVSVSELTPEEQAEIRADLEAGLLDRQTALELRQFKNVDEILERLETATIGGSSRGDNNPNEQQTA